MNKNKKIPYYNPTPSKGNYFDPRSRQEIEYELFYSSRQWAKLRLLKLSHNPLCEKCGYPAHQVHHIIATKEQWSLRFDWSNLQSLCRKHHEETKHRR
jgi:5-methylcytosine-specific restriction endonuclease McrA